MPVRDPAPVDRPITPWQHAVSAYHGFWLRVTEGLALSRGPYVEPACGILSPQPLPAELRIERMRRLFGVRFERHLAEDAALNSYACLDLLAQAFDCAQLAPPQGGVVCDVGCASFWNARALQAFFAPSRLIGVEVEGNRLLRGWRPRRDFAAGYLRDLPGAEYVVADYTRYRRPADVITAFYPFVTPGPVLAWRLPLRLLAPAALFASVAANLRPGGICFLASHGPDEALAAQAHAIAAGLRPLLLPTAIEPLWSRPVAPFASLWTSGVVPAGGSLDHGVPPPAETRR